MLISMKLFEYPGYFFTENLSHTWFIKCRVSQFFMLIKYYKIDYRLSMNMYQLTYYSITLYIIISNNPSLPSTKCLFIDLLYEMI